MNILFCDNHLLIAFKPAGVATQPDFVEGVKTWVKQKYGKPGNVFLEPIHRLDQPVSGLVIFARTSKALSRLQEAMRLGKIHKTYRAYVEGALPESEGVLEDYLMHGDHIAKVVSKTNTEGKYARLRYKVSRRMEKQTEVEIALETGRYHQIRIQFAHRGFPIVGDQKYGSKLSWKGEGIALRHEKVMVPHPVTQELMTFVVSESL